MSETLHPDRQPVKSKINLLTRTHVRTVRRPMSRATELRLLRNDPNWPKPVGGYYVESEIDEYLERMVAKRDAGGQE
jgi:hypothetical protein